jgi:hypothetical protein
MEDNLPPVSIEEQAFARRIALELALPIVEELLEPLAHLIVARLATRLEAGASCGRNESAETPTSAEDGSVGLSGLSARLVDAEVVASALGVSRECVYTHAEELGGHRIGSGPRGRLRFDLDQALAAWTSRSSSKESHQPKSPAVTSGSASRHRRGLGSSAELLPIKGSGIPADTHQDRSR